MLSLDLTWNAFQREMAITCAKLLPVIIMPFVKNNPHSIRSRDDDGIRIRFVKFINDVHFKKIIYVCLAFLHFFAGADSKGLSDDGDAKEGNNLCLKNTEAFNQGSSSAPFWF